MNTYTKVHMFWEGHKILRNLHLRFVLCSASQIYSGDFSKFCGLLSIYKSKNNLMDVSIYILQAKKSNFLTYLYQIETQVYKK